MRQDVYVVRERYGGPTIDLTYFPDVNSGTVSYYPYDYNNTVFQMAKLVITAGLAKVFYLYCDVYLPSVAV